MRRAVVALVLGAAGGAEGKGGGGGGGAPPPPPYTFRVDSRLLCDPCTELWAERTEARDYAGMDQRQAPHYTLTDVLPNQHVDEGAPAANYFGRYGQQEDWDSGYRTMAGETCRDLDVEFALPCVDPFATAGAPSYAEGGILNQHQPVFCDATSAATGVRYAKCNQRDDATGSATGRQQVPGEETFLVPCTSDIHSKDGMAEVTALQGCCRCGGGKYLPALSAYLTPPPPAPPATSAESMCLALPGCCYSATDQCAPSTTDQWNNGERVVGIPIGIDPAPELTGCCFSPEWRDVLASTGTRSGTASRLADSRSAPQHRWTTPGFSQHPTCSSDSNSSDSWPAYTVAHEPSPYWMRQDSATIYGVGLVFCKDQPDGATAPGWIWQGVAGAGGGFWVLWVLYNCIAHPIVSCVWCCNQDKSHKNMEPDCPKAAAVVIGGTCVCCAPCICFMLCMGSAPIFKRVENPQMPQGVVNPMGVPVVATATAMPMAQPQVAVATAMPAAQPQVAVATATAIPPY